MRAIGPLVEGALLILAVVVLAFPETRTPPMHLAVFVLYACVVGPIFWRLRKAKLLRKTIPQIHTAVRAQSATPRATFLTFAASLLGIAALFVMA